MNRHDFGPIVAERDGIQVAYCNACRFHHQVDLPKNLEEFYCSKFWEEEKPGALETIEAQLPWLRATWTDWLELLEQETANRKLLDVGCGWGHFGALAKERGWWALGVEPSYNAAHHAANLMEVIMAVVEDVRLTYSNVGVVSMLWLVEHLLDPRELLLRAKEWASVLLLVVPNEFTVLQAKADKVAAKPRWWVHKTHVNYFTSVTLSELLSDTGWLPTAWRGSYPMEQLILDGSDYTDNHEMGIALHKNVRDWELAHPVEREQWHKYWGERGEGRDLAVFCRRQQ